MSTRRLAAIMFADIAGYTAMMQSDEQKGLELVRRFKSTMEKYVPPYHGEILQFMGDGSLCIFQSAVEATEAAIDIQKELQQDPIVPLRIGLHVGDIVIQEDSIYGDGVNIASRIESMGIAGAVLLSENVRSQIKNKPEFELASLGEFSFKNVKEDMSVYALANEGLQVPKVSEMKGKGRKATSSKLSYRFLTQIASFGFLAMIIGVAMFWIYGTGSSQKTEEFSSNIQNSRIAVIPFENQTNDPKLDVLGNMAADAITRMLINLENIKVVQHQNVKNHLDKLGKNPEDFYAQTGAEYLIKGRIYAEEEHLIVESHIIDPLSPDIVFAIPPINGSKEKPSDLVNELSQKIAGYFALQNAEYDGTAAPNYEAFLNYEEGNKLAGSDYRQSKKLYLKAIEIDSNYTASHIALIMMYLNLEQRERADSLIQALKLRSTTLSKYNLYILRGLEAELEGNLEKYFQEFWKVFEIDPKLIQNNYQIGQIATQLNKPQVTVDVYQLLDPETITFDRRFHLWWFGYYAFALTRLGRLDEALEIIRIVPTKIRPYFGERQRIFTLQGRNDSLEHLISQMEIRGESEGEITSLMSRIVSDFAIKGDAINRTKWANLLFSRLQKNPQADDFYQERLAQVYYFMNDYAQSLAAYQKLEKAQGESIFYTQQLGCIYAKMGKQVQALEQIQKLDAMEDPYSLGKIQYAQALIYTSLGNKEQAFQLLKQAFQRGHGFNSENYDNDYGLIPLLDYEPYKAFVKPKLK